ncbi:hypothetical protein DPMN_039454 [Dreissena polymorpha]|uniref:Uncharacterized protein n=1 Tax=Dreissena polymorpha TaxID=45954 RepID=A0A9D4HS87_DREPO|nr:hypothetical protein DPMN_039454 [Dreissena polymorpha]
MILNAEIPFGFQNCRIVMQTAHSEVTVLTVPSNAIADWAHARLLRVHVKMADVKTDGKE